MRKTLLFASLALVMFSCKKEEKPSNIEYTNLNNKVVNETTDVVIDLNKDGVNDFVVGVQPVSDGIETRLNFRVSRYQNSTNKLSIQGEHVPKMMDSNETITKDNLTGYEWTAIQPAHLVTHITPIDPGGPYWDGTWKNKQNKYLPVQLLKDSKTYNGWIQISFSNANDPQIIVHDAAVSKVADVSIKAGQK